MRKKTARLHVTDRSDILQKRERSHPYNIPSTPIQMQSETPNVEMGSPASSNSGRPEHSGSSEHTSEDSEDSGSPKDTLSSADESEHSNRPESSSAWPEGPVLPEANHGPEDALRDRSDLLIKPSLLQFLEDALGLQPQANLFSTSSNDPITNIST